jgi:uncharacterized protein YecE (DUF72 family)
LVYSRPRRRAAEYLGEYAAKYRTVEIDSWFYKVPPEAEVGEYAAAVDADFRFTCKAPQELTLAHLRGAPAQRNPRFLSAELFRTFSERIKPLGERIGAIILEFEYLNRQKMSGEAEFLSRLGDFADSIPRSPPVAIECRNGNYMNAEYFALLKEKRLIPVFSEKRYMPPVAGLYGEYGGYLGDTAILRLLGGDRAEMEARTGERWDRIVGEQPGKGEIVRMVRNLMIQGKQVYVNVNNHYEGSAPLTVESIRRQLEEAEA